MSCWFMVSLWPPAPCGEVGLSVGLQHDPTCSVVKNVPHSGVLLEESWSGPYFLKAPTLEVLGPSPCLSTFSCYSVTRSCPALCNPTDCSTPGFPVLHHLLEFAQTHVRRFSDAIQPSHPLPPPSPPALGLSQHSSLGRCKAKSQSPEQLK